MGNAQRRNLAAALASALRLPEHGAAGGDEDGDNLQIHVGVGQMTGRIGLVFSHPVQRVNLDRERARTLALGILRLCDTPVAPPTIIEPRSE